MAPPVHFCVVFWCVKMASLQPSTKGNCDDLCILLMDLDLSYSELWSSPLLLSSSELLIALSAWIPGPGNPVYVSNGPEPCLPVLPLFPHLIPCVTLSVVMMHGALPTPIHP
jgi:hypothetical protein